MAITLRIVGVFYRAEIDLGAAGGTVKDVMDAAMQNDPSIVTPFYPGSSLAITVPDTKTGSPESFSATFTQDFVTPVVGTKYHKGTYEMSEQVTQVPIYSVWQYYLFDANNVYLNRGKGAIFPVDAKIADGQSLVFRLVNIHANAADLTSERLQRDYIGS